VATPGTRIWPAGKNSPAHYHDEAKTMDLFLIDAISLDTELVSDYPQMVKLGDHLFDEVSGVAKITNKGGSGITTYRNKEALKLIVINLYKGYRKGRAVGYSRDKGYYGDDSRYRQIWFKYDRIIDVIDALKTLGYADYKDGLHYPDEDVLYQSRVWATPKLLDLFHEFEIKQITSLKKARLGRSSS
jgi:hypothetical protein